MFDRKHKKRDLSDISKTEEVPKRIRLEVKGIYRI